MVPYSSPANVIEHGGETIVCVLDVPEPPFREFSRVDVVCFAKHRGHQRVYDAPAADLSVEELDELAAGVVVLVQVEGLGGLRLGVLEEDARWARSTQ